MAEFLSLLLFFSSFLRFLRLLDYNVARIVSDTLLGVVDPALEIRRNLRHELFDQLDVTCRENLSLQLLRLHLFT